MEPEVQAAIIKAASDWALLIIKDIPPPSSTIRDTRFESLENAFRIAYEKIGDVVSP